MVNFNVANLLEKCKDFESKGVSKNGFAKTAFLPEGKHRGRFLVDSTGEVFTSYYAYGFGNKGVRDPRGLTQNELPEGFVDELGPIAKKLKEAGKFKFGSSEVFIVPFFLESTDARSDRWEEGNLYYVIGNKKFSQSLIKFLSSIAKESPETIQTLLDPSQSAPQVEIQFTKGTTGGCNIGVAFPQKMSAPIDLTKQTYVSVEDAYIAKGFSLEKYNDLLAEARQALAELEGQPQPVETTQQNQANEFVAQPAPVSNSTETAQVVNPEPQNNEVEENNPWAKFRQQ